MRFTYFIQAGSDGPIKIGSASDPKFRLFQLQTANHLELRLLAAVPCMALPEKDVHYMFAAFKIRGEWFENRPEILAFIDQCCPMKMAFDIVTTISIPYERELYT